MIFVGDFIDRGPGTARSLRIARSMCEPGSASAVLGNHEFNAIGWAAQSEDGGFLRNHSAKNAHQHAEFLSQFEGDSADHEDAIRWFRSLPICWTFPVFGWSTLVGTSLRVKTLMSLLDERGVSRRLESGRAIAMEQPHTPLSKYS